MGRDGPLFKQAARMDARGTPTAGVYLAAFGALALILSSTFDDLLDWSASLRVLADLSGYLAVIVFRRRHPECFRPSKAWGCP